MFKFQNSVIQSINDFILTLDVSLDQSNKFNSRQAMVQLIKIFWINYPVSRT